MYVLLRGIKESMAHLPVAPLAGHLHTGHIPHPGYEE
jgi:hypothetical protein